MSEGPLVVDLAAAPLDPERGRRLDRASRLATIACERALGPGDSREAGVVLGIAFGAVDATAEYMRRLRDKGSRMVRPADFPSLVPSSPAGHVSIYLGLTGPALVVADLAASGECAVAQAWELIAAGEADRMVVGAVEERSRIVEEVLSVVFAHNAERGPLAPRREGAAAVALARDGIADLPALARLSELRIFRSEDRLAEARAFGSLARSATGSDAESDGAGEPPANALVVLARESARTIEALERSPWRGAPRVFCDRLCGTHEAAGGVAVAVAAAKVADRQADVALFVGSARGWSYAGVAWSIGRQR